MRLLAEAKEIVGGLRPDIDGAHAQLRSKRGERSPIYRLLSRRDIVQIWAKFFPENKRDPTPSRHWRFLAGTLAAARRCSNKFLTRTLGVAALDEPTAFLEVLATGDFTSPASFPAHASMSCAGTTFRLYGTILAPTPRENF